MISVWMSKYHVIYVTRISIVFFNMISELVPVIGISTIDNMNELCAVPISMS